MATPILLADGLSGYLKCSVPREQPVMNAIGLSIRKAADFSIDR